MSEKIEYIVNEKGKKVKAIISLNLLEKILPSKRVKSKNMTNEKIKDYEGILKIKIDPLKFQKSMRNEWE